MQCHAAQARIAQKTRVVGSRIAEDIEGSSKSSLDQALEAVKKGQDLMQRHIDLEAQVTNNTANR